MDYWSGEYCQGKKCGIWIHKTAVLAGYELERINYDLDSSRVIYIDNRVSESLDSLNAFLIGSWRDISCNETDSSRIELRKCMAIRGTKRFQCWDGSFDPDYYRFSKNGDMEIHSKKNCIIFDRESGISGWRLFQDGDYKYCEFKNLNKTWKYKILYFDKSSVLLERVKT